MAITAQLKHLTINNGKLIYQRRFPTKLVRAGALPTSYRRTFSSSDTNSIQFQQEYAAFTKQWEVSVSSKSNIDITTLHTLSRREKALAYLAAHKLKQGEALDGFTNTIEPYALESTHAFDELWDVSKQAEFLRVDVEELLTENTRIQRDAFHLWTTKDDHSSQFTLMNCWDVYADVYTNKDPKQFKREQNTWEAFIHLVGDVPLIASSIDRRLREWAKQKAEDGLKASSINRQATILMAVLNTFIEHHTLDVSFTKPKAPRSADKTTNRKPPFSYTEQQELMALLPTFKPWQQLYILVALHSGMHPSEASKLTDECFDFTGNIATVVLSEGGGKTEERERVVPLVLGVSIIKQAVEGGALRHITGKQPDNLGNQLSKALKQIERSATPYTLRNTLGHNADAVDMSATNKAALGGWSGKAVGLNARMARYGKGGKDFDERINQLAQAAQRMLAHLCEAE